MSLTSGKMQWGRFTASRIPCIDRLWCNQFLNFNNVARFACLEQFPQRVIGHCRIQIDGQYRSASARHYLRVPADLAAKVSSPQIHIHQKRIYLNSSHGPHGNCTLGNG